MKSNNIVLIGFMGVGKGSVAKELAKQTKLFALDCDDLIESYTNKKIEEIFKTEGEEIFRKIENNLANFLYKNVKNTIISTGGGFYKTKNLKKIGTVIYLQSEFESIIKRIQNLPNSNEEFQKRPLLKDIRKAKNIFSKREDKYRKKADFIINVENKTPKIIAKEIIKLLKGKNK